MLLRWSRFVRFVRTIARTSLVAAASAVFTPSHGSAASTDNDADSPPERNALYACQAIAYPGPGAWLEQSGAEEQLSAPENRIEGQDWSGQDLSGKNFSGKVFVGVNLAGAKLRGADLTDAIICGSDLKGADLSGAKLDRVLIGGDTELNDANLTNVLGSALKIANAEADNIRIDGADLRGAELTCDEYPACFGNGVFFATMAGADLRGATIGSLLDAPSNLGTARLDGVTTHLSGADDLDLLQLADGVGDGGRINFLPWYGQSGTKAYFSGVELRQLATTLRQMHTASAHPSFDCAHAATGAEKAICADPKLAALDSAMDWLWQRTERTPDRIAAQKKWIDARTTCPPQDYVLSPDRFSAADFASPADPKGCIGIAYAERIRQLAPESSAAVIDTGTYTTDTPFELPQDERAGLVSKYLTARGYRLDDIAVDSLGNGAGKISGSGLWANGHQCDFESAEAKTERKGSTFRIIDDAPFATERNSVSFAVTPHVVVRVGGDRQFYCGARGLWSDVYFRQPGDLLKLSGH